MRCVRSLWDEADYVCGQHEGQHVFAREPLLLIFRKGGRDRRDADIHGERLADSLYATAALQHSSGIPEHLHHNHLMAAMLQVHPEGQQRVA